MREFSFMVDGIPQPNPKVDATPRFRKGDKGKPTGFGTRKRDPKGLAAAWVRTIQSAAHAYMELNGLEPFGKGEPVLLGCSFWIPKVESNDTDVPAQKPDYSNYKYLVENALSGICYHDDEQVLGPLPGTKQWATDKELETPGVWITVDEYTKAGAKWRNG